jgi:hypothetical protein
MPEENTPIAFDPNARIIYRLPDNGVAVVTPSPFSGLTLEQIIATSVPAETPYRIVDVSTIPTDRTFRAAWEWVD